MEIGQEIMDKRSLIGTGKLQSPFPYFGGKYAVADRVWRALGDVKHYIEPFFGSGAVLLLRPDYYPQTMIESICDKDGFIANVWRALQFAPDEVARWCDWPVNHADLSARKKRLIENESRLLENLIADEKWYDPIMAGYWIWAASCWIGSGLTSIGQIQHIGSGGMGVHKLGKIPHLGDGGMGVHKLGKRPHIGSGGKGVHKLGQIPHIGNGGMGVHKHNQRPHIGDGEKDVREPYNTNIYEWFRNLSERLRYVRVVCGDWTRVCGGNWQDKIGICGMFFDPPYGVTDRDTSLYHHDSTTIAADVMAWVRERGASDRYRIVLAGYDEYMPLTECGWTFEEWKTGGGYSNTRRGKTRGMENRHREKLYYSPHCIRDEHAKEKSLFD